MSWSALLSVRAITSAASQTSTVAGFTPLGPTRFEAMKPALGAIAQSMS
jgi:hypothetical protein